MQKFKDYFVNNKYSQVLKDEIVKNNSNIKLFTEGGRIYPKMNTLEEIYCVMNDFQEIPKCKCGNDLKLKRYSAGFKEYCSTKCSNYYKAKILDKSKYCVNKIYFNKNEITKEILHQYINVNKVVDPNFYKMCDFKFTSEDAYLIYYDIEQPKCQMCDNPAVFFNFLKGYRDNCSPECANKNPNRIEKIKHTSLIEDEAGLNSYDKMSKKLRETNEMSGLWLPLEEYDDYQLYCRQIALCQYKFKDEIRLLENFELRGHANQDKYHLDHKFSKIEGFKQNIAPYIIGNICNLEMITARNNLSKNRKCSITKEELFEHFFS